MDILADDLLILPMDVRNLLFKFISTEELLELDESLINMKLWKERLVVFGYTLSDDFISWVENYNEYRSTRAFMRQFFLEEIVVKTYKKYDYENLITTLSANIELVSPSIRGIMKTAMEKFLEDTLVAKEISARHTDIANDLRIQKIMMFDRKFTLVLRIDCKSKPPEKSLSWGEFKRWAVYNTTTSGKNLESISLQLREGDILIFNLQTIPGFVGWKFYISKDEITTLIPFSTHYPVEALGFLSKLKPKNRWDLPHHKWFPDIIGFTDKSSQTHTLVSNYQRSINTEFLPGWIIEKVPTHL